MYNFKENESLYATIVDTVTPTTSTEGVVGQFYIDQSTDPASLYLCTKVETVDSTTNYTWTKQGGDGAYMHYIYIYPAQYVNKKIYFSYVSTKKTPNANITELISDMKSIFGEITPQCIISASGHILYNPIYSVFAGENYLRVSYTELTQTKQNITIDNEEMSIITATNKTSNYTDIRSAYKLFDTVVAL